MALKVKREEAQAQLNRADKAIQDAQRRSTQAQALKKKAAGTELAPLAEKNAKDADRQLKNAKARHEVATADVSHLATMPEDIHQRDTTRENLVTSATMSVMGFIAWVLLEYFGGLRMEPSTFLEYFLHLPVEVRITWKQNLYRIDIHYLSPDKAELLRQACAEITRRRIRRSGRWLKFEVADLTKSRDGP